MDILQNPEFAKAIGASSPLWPDILKSPHQVHYTIIASRTPISKRFGAVDGKPKKLGSDAPLFSGIAERCTLKGSATDMARQLADDLDTLGPTNVVVCAPPPTPPAGQVSWPVVTDAEVESTAGAISRTKKYFAPPAGPALMGLDFDVKDYPKEIMLRLEGISLSSVLESVFPAMANAASVSRPSMSVGVRHKGTGAQTPSNSGLHRFFFVTDGLQVETAAKILAERLMLQGWLWGLVTAAGHILPRTLIDVSASSDSSRLWYEGTPVLESADLELVPDARRPVVREGDALDLGLLQPLNATETEHLEAMKSAMRERYADVAEATRLVHKQTLRARLPDATQRQAFEADHDRAVDDFELQGDFPIPLDDGRIVTPREILAAPNRYHGLKCPDPLEPEYGGGRNKAIIIMDSRPRIESMAHGGATYMISIKVADYWVEVPAATDIQAPQDPFGHGDTSTVLDVPAGVLPTVVEDWAKDTADRIGTPMAYPVTAALATISGAIGAKLRIQPKEQDYDWTEPGFLWLAIVENPGGKKSPIISAAVAPLAKVNAEKVAEGARQYAQWEVAAAAAKKAKEPVPPEPVTKRNTVDNFTMEALAVVLADNPSGVLVVQDELTALIGSFDAYKAGGKGGDRSQMLRLFDGKETSIDRVGRRQGLVVPCWGAAVLGGIQPRKITEMANNLDADGLLQRFVPIFGDGKKRAGVDRAPDENAKAAYFDVVQTLARAPDAKGNAIRLSRAALAVWRPLAGRIDALAELPGLSDAWRGHLGKWPGISARLLLVCHVLDQWHQGFAELDSIPVSGDTAGRAVKLVEWLLGNSLRFYSECIGAGEAGEDARWIAGHILAKPITDKITRRDIGQAKAEFRDKPDRVARAMLFLSTMGWVTPETERRLDDRYGATQWTVCPAVHDGRFLSYTELERQRRQAAQKAIAAAGRERSKLFGGVDA